ncbi:MAG TPA: CAP domain-containing protein [Gemmatimonadaceae bacterium]
MEREIVDEINSARTNPRAYANVIAELLPYFDGDVLRRPGMRPRQTVEGIAPARQAIDALREQRPVGALNVTEGLALAARDHVNDQSRSGQTGHRSSDGTAPDARADRYGTWAVSYSENIAYGQFSRGADVVLSLIIDDGVPDRGHRRNIFDPSFNVVGVACGPHPRFGTTCVIEHAGLFISETAGAHDRARRNKPMM